MDSGYKSGSSPRLSKDGCSDWRRWHYHPFSFLFNICLPHDDPINPRMLPERFSPISPPIEATDIENFVVFKHSSHLASASIKKSQTGPAISCVSVFIYIFVN
jgi:hypothetical protein